MSWVTNEGVTMSCKAVTANLLKVVGCLVEPITYIAKSKGYLEESISIIQPPIKVTSSNMVISPSLYRFFFFGGMLRSNSRSHQSIYKRLINDDSYIENSATSVEG